jgi:DNA-directed RNA polymerase specialized sigma24 family protein
MRRIIMTHTFEELAATELDALYQGALFLRAGDPGEAELLLIEAVAQAFKKRAMQPASASMQRWLERCLVQALLRQESDSVGTPSPATSSAGHREAPSVGDVSPGQLYAAAEPIPPLARAALWLVILRRWTYADATDAVGVETHDIHLLLSHRETLLRGLTATKRHQSVSGG